MFIGWLWQVLSVMTQICNGITHIESYWVNNYPESEIHGANMGPTWGRQDPGGPHAGAMIFAIWVYTWNSLKL